MISLLDKKRKLENTFNFSYFSNPEIQIEEIIKITGGTRKDALLIINEWKSLRGNLVYTDNDPQHKSTFDINQCNFFTNNYIIINKKKYEYTRNNILNNNYPGMNIYPEYAIIKNFLLNNDSNKTINIEGPVFVCSRFDQIFHLLNYEISMYEFLKKTIKDLKIILICDSFPEQQIIQDLILHYELKENKDFFILNSVDFNINFKEFIFIPFDKNGLGTEFATINYDTFINVYSHYNGGAPIKESFPAKTKILRETFKKYFIDDFTFPKKIFISRSLVTEKKYKNSEESRSISFQCNADIESLFSSLGYVIINLEGMGLFHQIKYFYNATHIAGISGSNLYNSIWSNPETTILDIEIPRKQQYDFPWAWSFYDLNFKHKYLFFLNKDLFKKDMKDLDAI